MDNRFNEVFSSFFPFNCEFSSGNRLIDIFPNQFLFYSLNRKRNCNVKSYLCNLNSITFQASLDLHLVVVISDASIKNQIATLILHIHTYNSCYKLKILELIKKKNLVLELTQENSIESSIQDHLPYILNYHGSCYYSSSLP